MGGGSGSTPVPVDKDIIHLLNFVEAGETINEPEQEYWLLEEDDTNYYISKYNTNTPIDAGNFYKYEDGTAGSNNAEICINQYSYHLVENNLTSGKQYVFNKDDYDIGSIYTSIEDQDITFEEQDPLVILNKTLQNLMESSTVPYPTYTGITFDNSRCNLYIQNQVYSVGTEIKGYYMNGSTNMWEWYTTESRKFIMMNIPGGSILKKITSYTESDQ